MLATAKAGGTFSSVPMPSSAGGWTPAIAVSSDGTKLAVSWFDSVNLDLDVALPAGPLQLAEVTPTLHQPSVPPPAASCSPNGTALTVTARNIAFDTNCLAAPRTRRSPSQFTNNDTGTPHNVEIFTNSERDDPAGRCDRADRHPRRAGSGAPTGDALPAGSYYFRCDIHPSRCRHVRRRQVGCPAVAGPSPIP